LAKRSSPILLYVIIGLAGIGLASFVFKDPSSLLKVLVTTLVIGLVIFLIVNAIFKRRMYGSGVKADEMRKYRRAVKQSQKKYQSPNRTVYQNSYPQTAPKRKHKRRPTHLRVIDGKKSIKKNNNDRASN
jgi:ABC-type nickel/cobalt efflux system permease component RcnA